MSIWKTPDQKPDVFKPHTIMVVYEAHDEAELMLSTQYEVYTADRYINRWCYLDELLAQADKAERLLAKVDWLEHNKNAWGKVSELKEEHIQRLQKAVDYALQVLDNVIEIGGIDLEIAKIKQLIKGE